MSQLLCIVYSKIVTLNFSWWKRYIRAGWSLTSKLFLWMIFEVCFVLFCEYSLIARNKLICLVEIAAFQGFWWSNFSPSCWSCLKLKHIAFFILLFIEGRTVRGTCLCRITTQFSITQIRGMHLISGCLLLYKKYCIQSGRLFNAICIWKTFAFSAEILKKN